MIRSSVILATILIFLALYTKRKRSGQMGPNLCYSQSQVVSAYQSFRPVAQFLFLMKVQFFGSFLSVKRKGYGIWFT